MNKEQVKEILEGIDFATLENDIDDIVAEICQLFSKPDEGLKEEIDKIVREIRTDISGVDAVRYYTDKICQLIERDLTASIYEEKIREAIETGKKVAYEDVLNMCKADYPEEAIEDAVRQALKSNKGGG